MSLVSAPSEVSDFFAQRSRNLFLLPSRGSPTAYLTTVTEPNRAHAADVRAGRYVWDQAVHAHFRENCSYFLVRLATPDIPGIERILSKHLQRAGVKGSCTYVIYGFHDALIRAWMTEQKRTTFLQSVTDDLEIDAVDEFRVETIQFGWSTVSNFGRRSFEYHLRQVIEVAEILQDRSNDTDEPPNDAIEALVATNLLHRIPELPTDDYPDPVKVYVALTRISPGKSVRDERERVQEIAMSPFPSFGNVSIYHGIGFAQYLIKGVIPTYRDVLPTLTHLTERLTPLGLRSATYLIADSNVNESDHIDFGWEDLDLSLYRLSNLIGGDASRRLTTLPKTDRQAISRIFDAYSSYLLGTPFERYFIDLLRHRIGDPEVVLGETLAFLVRLELYVRELCIRLWAGSLGNKQWRDKVIELAKKPKVDFGGRGPEHGSLKAFLRMTAVLVDSGEIASSAAEEALGPTWRTTLATNVVAELRNGVAHGDFFRPEREGAFMERWDSNVRQVLDIGRGYVDVAERYSRQFSKSNGGATHAAGR